MKILNNILLKAVLPIAMLCLLQTNASACYYCWSIWGGWVCNYISGDCVSNGWGGGWSSAHCIDLALNMINPNADYILTASNGTAWIIVGGKKTEIASDAFVAFYKSMNEKYSKLNFKEDKELQKQIDSEYVKFFKTDDHKVSSRLLEQVSKETGLRILDKEPTPRQVELTVELFQNNTPVAKTTTDSSGNFTIKNILDGEYRLKISNPNSETSEYYLMTIGEVGTIICCCPGPPCEDPLEIYFGPVTVSKNRALYIKNNEITATFINFKIKSGHEK